VQVVSGLSVSAECLDTPLANKHLVVWLSPIVWSNTLEKIYFFGFKYGKIKDKFLNGLKLFIVCLYPVTK